jgi:MFS family permease
MLVQMTRPSVLVLTPLQMLLAVFACTATSVILGAQPMLIGLYSDHLHLDLKQNGWLLSTEQLGGVCGAIIGYWLAARIRWSLVIGAACVAAVVLNLASGYVDDFRQILATRFLCGLSTVIAYTVAVYVLSHAAKPDRAFGLLLVAQGLLSSAYIMLVPLLNQRFGYAATVGSHAWWLVAVLISIVRLPAGGGGAKLSEARGIASPDARPIVGLAALVGGFLLQLSAYAVWGFLEQVGRGNGLADATIGYAIGLGSLAGTPAAFIPVILGARFGRLWLIAGATACFVASYAGLSEPLNFMSLMLWVCVLNVGWVVGLPYYMSLTVIHDSGGRFTRLMPFAQILAAAVGPACSAVFISGEQLWPIFLVAAIAVSAGLLAVAGASILGESSRTGKRADES